MTVTDRPDVGVRGARAVTEVLSPAVLCIGTLLLIGAVSLPNHLLGLGWGLLAAVFVAVIPYGLVLRKVRRGTIGDRHVRNREERIVPLLVAIGWIVGGLGVLFLIGAPRQLMALVVSMLTGALVTMVITLVWKISVHVSVAAGTATVLSVVFGPWLLLSFLLVAAVGWSRVTLRAHTLGQVLGGAPMGAVIAAVVFPLLR